MSNDRAPTVEGVPGVSSARAPARLRDLVELLRPTQWVKNVVIFAGPAAGLKLSSAVSVGQAIVAFVVFCLVASATYAINDVLDRKADASHPTKRNSATTCFGVTGERSVTR